STASCAPVEAPEGTAARPIEPSSSRTSTSTVGLPRLSRISRPMMSMMAVMGASSGNAGGWLALLLQQGREAEKAATTVTPAGELSNNAATETAYVENAFQLIEIEKTATT